MMNLDPLNRHDKLFKKGISYFEQGYHCPTDNQWTANGWNCAKAMRDIKAKFLEESRTEFSKGNGNGNE